MQSYFGARERHKRYANERDNSERGENRMSLSVSQEYNSQSNGSYRWGLSWLVLNRPMMQSLLIFITFRFIIFVSTSGLQWLQNSMQWRFKKPGKYNNIIFRIPSTANCMSQQESVDWCYASVLYTSLFLQPPNLNQRCQQIPKKKHSVLLLREKTATMCLEKNFSFAPLEILGILHVTWSGDP